LLTITIAGGACEKGAGIVNFGLTSVSGKLWGRLCGGEYYYWFSSTCSFIKIFAIFSFGGLLA
jgi:hypothetical protein